MQARFRCGRSGDIGMRVDYDSAAIFDEKCQAVKFAGQIREGRHGGRFVICQVPKQILIERFSLSDPEPDVLLQCFLMAKGEITRLATQKAMLGNYRPVILAEEFLPGELPANASAGA